MNDFSEYTTQTLSENATETLGFRCFDYVFFQVLKSCHELGLSELFEDDPNAGWTFEQIRARIQIPSHSVRLLLLAACAFGLLRRDEESKDYFLVSPLLASENSLPVDFRWIRRVYLPSWAYLTESLRTGTNAGLQVLPGDGGTLYERMSSLLDLEAEFTEARGDTVRVRRLPLLLDALETRAGISHILDVGGGDGTTAIGIVERFPSMQVTALDFPSVLALGREAIARSPHSDRISLKEGDAIKDCWPEGPDCVLFSAFLEIFSEATIRSLLSKAYALLPEGGQILINQTVCNDLESGPQWPAILSLYFANLASGEGMTYPKEDFRNWVLAEGFRSFEVFDSGNEDASVMIGVK